LSNVRQEENDANVRFDSFGIPGPRYTPSLRPSVPSAVKIRWGTQSSAQKP